MGQEIVYCAGCARMLRTVDFEKGLAYRKDGKVVCTTCVPSSARIAPAPHTPRAFPSLTHDSNRHKPVRIEEPPPSRLPWGLLAAGGALVCAAIVILILGLRSHPPSHPPPEPNPTPPIAVPKPPPPKEEPREQAGLRELEKAREALKVNPQDLDAVVALFERAAESSRNAGYGAQAERELASVLELRREHIQAEVGAAESESRAARDREDFKGAADALEKAGRLSRLAAVREALKEKGELLQQDLLRLREDALRQATEARRRGAEDAVRAILARAAKWGDPAWTSALEEALRSVPAPPSPEAGLYRQSWAGALEVASTRDYSRAIDALKEAAATLKEPKVREEAAQDQSGLGRVREVFEQALQAFSKIQAGQKIALEYFDAGARPRKAEGVVARRGPGWIAVKEESEVVFVDAMDLAPSGVALLARERSAPADLALFLMLERSAPEESLALLPEKYQAYSRERAPAVPRAQELEARRLFHDAFDPEREWPERRRKAGSIGIYRRLLAEFGETLTVRQRRELIALRAEAAADLVFQPDDLKGLGTFRLDAPEKAASSWLVSAAPVARGGLETHLEMEFEAGSESAWKAWAYVGACCAESLSLYWQFSDLTETNSKGQKVSLEPGSGSAMTVKASLPKLAKSHLATRVTPAAWGWIALPTPKGSPAGTKKAWLIADRPGLAVRTVIVSSVRTTAPSDAEARELEEFGTSTVLQGLVGWWKLDESAGPSLDSSGNNHTGTWIKNPAFQPGGAPAIASNAGCLSLSGAGQFVDLANPGALPSGTMPRTLCGWGRTQTTSDGYRWIASFGAPQTSQAMFIGQKGKVLVGGAFADDLEVPGFWDDAWHHIALTYDGTRARLYADGVERTSGARNWRLSPKCATIGRQVEFSSEFWNGLVDDVRIYSRVLTEAEIRQIAQGR